MDITIRSRLLSIFTGSLIGYVVGWIWGWSLFDPNSDVWALTALVGALVGLVVGILPQSRKFATPAIGATFGLYAGWLPRTWLFGDVTGGWGVGIMLAGMVGGGMLAARLDGEHKRSVLVATLHAAFFGGFFIDVIILDVLLGWINEHSILTQAPWVLLSGLVGGILATRLAVSRPSR